MSVRRSIRSTSTPTGTTKSTLTAEYTRLSPAMRVGSVVSAVATSGTATNAMPSATFPAALPAHSQRKSRPSAARPP